MMTLVIQTTVLVGVDRKRRNSVLVSSACYSWTRPNGWRCWLEPSCLSSAACRSPASPSSSASFSRSALCSRNSSNVWMYAYRKMGGEGEERDLRGKLIWKIVNVNSPPNFWASCRSLQSTTHFWSWVLCCTREWFLGNFSATSAFWVLGFLWLVVTDQWKFTLHAVHSASPKVEETVIRLGQESK